MSHPPSSLIPALGQDVLRRPSLDSILARRHSEVAPGRRPSADSALSVATIQFTVPTNDPPSVKKSILWDDINGAADAQNDISPPLLRECQGSPKRAPLFGQVGELEGLRMSQCLISRVLSDELEGGGSGSPSDGKGDADQSGHFRARSDSSDPCGPRVRRMNSNAGEMLRSMIL